jgi:hypothetical protein
MPHLFLRADSVVRGEAGSSRMSSLSHTPLQLLAVIVLFGSLYGAVMGTFGGMEGGARALQALYSALKAPLLLLATFGLSLPSFFIFNTLYGLRADFPQALNALLVSQAGLTVLLASLAPYTLLWNLAATSHQAAVLFNALMFGIATAGGQLLLRRSYAVLLKRDMRHLTMLRLWGMLYAFVGIQMGWILRPFVGDPDKPVAFFRADSWGNAYLAVFQLVRHLFVR